MSLLDRRLLITAGKGGVGRSTVSAALALAAAQSGKRVLVCEVNTQPRIPGLFDSQVQGDEPFPVAPGVDSLVVRPDPAMREYVLMKLRFETLYRAVFENRWVSRFLHFIPSLPELVMLGKILFHVRERHWDLVVIDAPATGHGITFLGVPQAILDTVPPGAMHSEALWMRDLLVDPDRTLVNLVSLPEELPVNETLELAGATESQLGMGLGRVFLNRFVPERFSADERRLFPPPGADEERAPLLDAAFRAAHAQALRAERSAHFRERLQRGLDLPLTALPQIFHPASFGAAQTRELAAAMIREGL